jgi:hypothetical protein
MMKIVAIALVILSLASVSNCTNWEYAGNWSTANTTAINSAITDTMTASADVTKTEKYNIGLFAKKLSVNLETIQDWAQFWNVFVVLASTGSDAVVYGYAFNNHWLWRNNLKFPGLTPAPEFGGKEVGLVIWKDYNC